MPKRIVFGFAVAACILVHSGNAGGSIRSNSNIENLLPGDTLRYTVDGSTPDRTSPFVVYGNSLVTISATTTFKARLYRPGYQASVVQSRLVYVAGTSYYGVVNGWNLVSVPLTVGDRRKGSIFTTAAGYAYEFNAVLGYVRKDTLLNGVGYMLKFNSQQTIAIGGVQRTLDTIIVQPDWNVIGALSVPLSIAAVQQIPQGIIQSPFYGYNGTYQITDSLRPAKGYWVRAGSAGMLILSTVSPLDKEASPLSSVTERAGTITISDLSGAQQTLYFSSESLEKKDLDYFELPPPPPAGIFDARFETNRILECVKKGGGIKEVPIRASYAQYPLTMTWEMKDQSIAAALIIGNKEVRLKSNGSITITDPKAAIVLRLGGQLSRPTEFVLDQNYPNPWNPTTTIRYGLPRSSFVTLTIFNTLGQQVAQPVNEQLQAGYHEVEFRGDGLASGVYFYRLDVGNFSSAKKFILLK